MIPLVFLHGFLGSPSDWDPVISYLPDIPYFAIELPGHGKTPFTTEIPIPDLPRMHLIGYSMGGRIAMQYAMQNREKIASLTLLSAHSGLLNPEERKKRLASDLFLKEKIIHSFDDFLASWYDQPIFAGFKPEMTKRRQHNPKELAESLIHYSLGKQPVFPQKEGFFVVGEKDTKYRELYPDAQVVLHAGHMVHLEEPLQVAEIIQRRILCT